MDRAEAIKELTQWCDQMKSHGVPNYGKKLTALDLAIEALLADTVHKPDYSYEAGMVRRLKEWQESDKAIQGDAESATTTDCISRQQAVEAVTKTIRDKFSFADWYEQLLETGLEIENLIKELPPVTPTERTGEWVNSKGEPVDDRYSVYCSRCKAWSEYRDIYCGNCGAKMGGDDNE